MISGCGDGGGVVGGKDGAGGMVRELRSGCGDGVSNCGPDGGNDGAGGGNEFSGGESGV